ncbi:MAG: hypothetical protein ACYS76_07865 [Planctomycetota bacterium]
MSKDSETSLEIGEPIRASLDVDLRDNKYQFNKQLRGRLGEQLELARRDARMYGKLHIMDRGGKFDRRYDIRLWDG